MADLELAACRPVTHQPFPPDSPYLRPVVWHVCTYFSAGPNAICWSHDSCTEPAELD
ncbi:MAG TPA: hypothetical protein VEI97_20490 [bacterium]|nr:hypothetical protein [bacterium]